MDTEGTAAASAAAAAAPVASQSTAEAGHVDWSHRRLTAIDSNEVEKLQSSTGCIHTLNLQCNFLQTLLLPPSLSGLRVLYLGANALTQIPDLSALPALQELYLNNNFLENLSGLERVVPLRVLDLRQNKLVSLAGMEKHVTLERYAEIFACVRLRRCVECAALCAPLASRSFLTGLRPQAVALM